MPERHLKLGLVGVGGWGRKYLQTIATLDGIRLAAVASRNPETANLVPPDCRVVAAWQDLVAVPDIDGVIVATPPSSHAEILLAAIAIGKPVLVEKPVVQSRADAEQIRDALVGRRATILVDHIHLFHPAFRALVRAAASTPIRSIKTSAGNHGPFRDDVSVLWDWGPHDLAMCLTLASGPARVTRATRSDARPVGKAVAERLDIELSLAGNIPAHIRLSNIDDRHRWFAVELDAETLVFRDYLPEKLVRFAPGADIHGTSGRAIAVVDEPPLSLAVREFADMIRTGNVSRASIDLGLTVVELIADIEKRLGKIAGS